MATQAQLTASGAGSSSALCWRRPAALALAWVYPPRPPMPPEVGAARAGGAGRARPAGRRDRAGAGGAEPGPATGPATPQIGDAPASDAVPPAAN